MHIHTYMRKANRRQRYEKNPTYANNQTKIAKILYKICIFRKKAVLLRRKLFTENAFQPMDMDMRDGLRATDDGSRITYHERRKSRE